ncbi:hypothetical protein [Flavobacterium silvaticum]|uniref:Lipoprotein n=1 Tax=Flavobacterium silvaticum TaxID=1852020 RepID=A0A972JHH5_9FLAO|nr:hypothetical protein [Flavobacterium silvaticum]NMH29246.1 hypothetical protein [Flavobacterium silvaticum]
MKMRLLFLLFPVVFLSACTDNDDNQPLTDTTDKVLLLRVDYLTNNFEAGEELSFEGPQTTFTVSNEYVSPGDFGYLKLSYDEKEALLFHGEIIWNGTGSLIFPQNFTDASEFEYVLTEDYITPASGFENVFNSNNEPFNSDAIWSHVQGLRIVRDYLNANPTATVKFFLYTPSVGFGNPADWDWYFILKN